MILLTVFLQELFHTHVHLCILYTSVSIFPLLVGHVPDRWFFFEGTVGTVALILDGIRFVIGVRINIVVVVAGIVIIVVGAGDVVVMVVVAGDINRHGNMRESIHCALKKEGWRR